MLNFPDNHEIRMTEIHGYPTPPKPIYAECGCEVAADETLFRSNGKLICEYHFKEEKDDMTLREFANIVGADIVKAGDCN